MDRRIRTIVSQAASSGKNITTLIQVQQLCPTADRGALNACKKFFKDIHNQITFYINAVIFTSVYELGIYIESCHNMTLHELGIGNLATYPSVIKNFRTTVVHEITIDDICQAVNKAKKATRIGPDDILEALSHEKKIPKEELGVLIKGNKIGIFFAESKKISNAHLEEIRSGLEVVTSQLYHPRSDVYKRLERKVQKSVAAKIEKQLISKTDVAGITKHMFYSFDQRGSLNKKQIRKLKKLCTSAASELFEGVNKTLYDVEEMKYTVCRKMNEALNAPEVKSCSFLQYLDTLNLVNLEDYLIIKKGSQFIPERVEEEEATKVEEKEVFEYKLVKIELLKLLLRNIKQRRTISQLFQILQEFEKRTLAEKEISSATDSILVYISSHPDLAKILDLFSESMILVIRTVLVISEKEEKLEEKEFEELMEQNLPAACISTWTNYINILLSLYNFIIENPGLYEHDNTAICFEEKIFSDSLSCDNLVNSAVPSAELINSLPYGVDIMTTLSWKECYEATEGIFLNFLLRNEEKLVGKFVVMSNGVIVRLNGSFMKWETFEDRSKEEIICYLLEFILHKSSALAMLVDQWKQFCKDSFSTPEACVQYCIEVLLLFPSDSLRAWFMKHLMLQYFDTKILDVYEMFLAAWPEASRCILIKIGKFLKICSWSIVQVPSHSLPSVSPSEFISSSSGGLRFEEPQEHEADTKIKTLDTTGTSELTQHSDFTPESDAIIASNGNLEMTIECADGSEQQNFVETQILRLHFGVGLKYEGEQKINQQNYLNTIQSSVRRLADQLYSEDIHFVMELVQNADDNDYPKTIGFPSIHFKLYDDQIIVENNESGFNKENVKALCDVGQSTKESNSRKGFIGKKGIGFKSVFRISNSPEIHSNGFHVCFDIGENGEHKIGYIKPKWINDIHPYAKSAQAPTIIRLPFKKNYSPEEISRLRSEISKVDSNLLLFLNTLREIRITEPDTDKMRIIRRTDIEEGRVVQIQESYNEIDHVTRWLRVESSLEIPRRIRNVRGPEEQQTQTSIWLAFPLEKLDTDQWHLRDQTNPLTLPLFAYLPTKLKDTLRFIIQADFIITSSRESIDQDNLWNQWILEQIPSLFAKAIQSIRDRSEEIGNWINSINLLLPYIPIRCNSDYLKDLANDIGNELSQFQWLVDIEGNIKQPQELIYLSDEQKHLQTSTGHSIQQIFSNDVLVRANGKSWIHPEIQMNRRIAKLCKLDKFSILHAANVLKLSSQEEELNSSDVFEFVVLCYSVFVNDSFSFLQEFRKLCWVPLVGCDHFVAPNQFISLVILGDSLQKFSGHIRENANVIDNSKFSGLTKEHQLVLDDIFNQMNVTRCTSLLDFVRLCIIPEYKEILSDLGYDSNSLISLSKKPKIYKKLKENIKLIFGKEFQSQFWKISASERNGLLEQLRKLLIIPIENSNVVHICNTSLHFHFKKDQVLLDLLQTCCSGGWYSIEIQQSVAPFLQELGITFGPQIIPAGEGQNDYDSPELYSLLEQVQSKLPISNIQLLSDFLARMLDNKAAPVQKYYSKFLTKTDTTPSAFATLLKTTKWVFCKSHNCLHAPQEFYLPIAKAKEIFSSDCCELSHSWLSDVVTILGVKGKVTSDHVFSYIQKLYEIHKTEQEKENLVELSTTEQKNLKKCYQYLVVCNLGYSHFPNSPWVFMSTTKNDFSSGKFFYSYELCRYDPTGVLELWGIPCVFERFGHSMNVLFKKANIPEIPELENYVKSFTQVKKYLPFDLLSSTVWKLFNYWGYNDNTDSIVRTIGVYLEDCKMFPVFSLTGDSNGSWVDSKEQIYYADTRDILRMVPELVSNSNGNSRIRILYCPPNNESELYSREQKNIFSAFNIYRLSSKLEESVIPLNQKLDLDLYKLVKEILPHAERFFRKDPALVNAFMPRATNFFKELKFFKADAICVNYKLENLTSTSKFSCYLDEKEKALYCTGIDNSSAEIVTILGRYLYVTILNQQIPERFVDWLKFPNKAKKILDYCPDYPSISSDIRWKLADEDIYIVKKKKITRVIDPNVYERTILQSYEDANNLKPGDDSEINLLLARDGPVVYQDDVSVSFLPDCREPLNIPTLIPQTNRSSVVSSDVHDFYHRNESFSVNEGGSGSSIVQFDPSTSNPTVCDWKEFSTSLGDTDTLHVAQLSSCTEPAYMAEKLVCHLLQKKFPNLVITWMNEKEESQAPYDLKIGDDHFIEVKSTNSPTPSNIPFPMSCNEIGYALENKYDIYRVFGIQSEPKVIVIEDIGNKIRNKQVTVCLQPVSQ